MLEILEEVYLIAVGHGVPSTAFGFALTPLRMTVCQRPTTQPRPFALPHARSYTERPS